MDKITKAIGEALGMYGEKTKGVILYHLEHDYDLTLCDFKDQPEKFVSVLQHVFDGLAVENDIAVFLVAYMQREFNVVYCDEGLAALIRHITADENK